MKTVADALRRTIAPLEPVLFELGDYLHGNVEEAGLEYRSSAYITSVLTDHGFTVRRGVAGLPTSFIGELGSPDAATSIAFICEYDGLPPYGQSCGHNVVSACSVGAALILAPLAAEYDLRLLVIGTPAEEGFGGKYVMADAGLFEGLDAALLIYPGMADIAASRTLRARTLNVSFHGKAAHAAAHPELGANALDAFVLSYTGISALRQHLPPQARVHGIVHKGGSHAQVVPDLVEATFVVRGPDAATVDEVERRVRECVVGGAAQTGTHAKIDSGARTSMTLLPNAELAATYDSALLALGGDPGPTDELMGAWSTDAGYLSRFVPLLQPQLAMTREDVPPHSHEFHEASSGKRAREAISRGSMLLGLTAVSIASKPGLRDRIRDEFEVRLGGEVGTRGS